MLKIAAAYAATLIVMVAIDMVWLGLIARPLYQQGIGHLMAERPNVPAALLFYLVYAAGLIYFAVWPNVVATAAPGWGRTLISAALFGAVAYATYDLTNLATLKGWPVGLAVLDMAWGSAVSVAAAAAGRFALVRLGAD